MLESENSSAATQNMMQGFDSGYEQADMFDSPNPTFRNRRNMRSNVATGYNDVEFVQPRPVRKKRTSGPKVKYVESVKKSRRKKKKFEWSWAKVGWILCVALLFRLVFMDRGIIDFYSKDTLTLEKQKELKSLISENKDIKSEIHRIRTSPQYQKKIARDHLGVIAKDEYLILFPKD